MLLGQTEISRRRSQVFLNDFSWYCGQDAASYGSKPLLWKIIVHSNYCWEKGEKLTYHHFRPTHTYIKLPFVRFFNLSLIWMFQRKRNLSEKAILCIPDTSISFYLHLAGMLYYTTHREYQLLKYNLLFQCQQPFTTFAHIHIEMKVQVDKVYFTSLLINAAYVQI